MKKSQEMAARWFKSGGKEYSMQEIKIQERMEELESIETKLVIVNIIWAASIVTIFAIVFY